MKALQTDFVNVEEDSRINIKLKTGQETEINGQGPTLTEKNVHDLLTKLDALQEGDMLVLAGAFHRHYLKRSMQI